MAKRFRYNLEALLKYRSVREDERKKDLAFATMAAEQVRLEISNVHAEIERARAEIRDRAVGSITAAELLRYSAYTSGVQCKLERLHAVLAEKEKIREEKRQLFIEARKERRAIEILKEKKFAEYRKNLGREEAKLVDDIISSRRAIDVDAGADGD